LIFAEVKHDCPIDAQIYGQYLAAACKQFADDMPECSGWFMVRVGVRQEHNMRDRLKRAGLDAWLPETTEQIIKHSRRKKNGKPRKRHTEEKKVLIFDGHVLVRFVPSPEAWHAISNISGVQAIYARVGSFEAPSVEKRLESALSENVVKRLRELETETHGEDAAPKFKPGEQVKITDGPFAGSFAIVTHKRVGWGLCCVEVQAFGGNVPMTLEENQLEAV
jgi:transcription termination/antitermination protein NusG